MPISITCLNCGEVFKVTPNRANAKFCSHRCAMNWHHKNNPKYALWKPAIPKGGKRWYYSASMRGKHHSEETKSKMRETSKRLIKEGKKRVPRGWNKGKTWEEIYGPERAKELKQKLAEMGRRQGGPKHPNWKGGSTPLRQREVKRRYKDTFFQVERKKAFERDNYICQECGIKPSKPIAHHIVPYRISRDHSASNLLTTCWRCHARLDDEFQKAHPELYPEARSTEFKLGQVPWNKKHSETSLSSSFKVNIILLGV